MAVEWFCQVMGSELGPFNVEQLVDMARQHQITPEDLVRRNKSRWVPAYQVKGLFEAAAKPPKPQPETPEPSPGKSAKRVDKADSGVPTAVVNGKTSPAEQSAPSSTLPKDDWYCIASGEKQGPLSFEQLQTLATEGRLRDRDRVWRGSAPKWRKAGEVKGLKLPANRE